MSRVGLGMLFGAGGKYASLIFGLSFAVLLITQQVAIFLGVLQRSTGPLQNIGAAAIWVASEQTVYVDMVRGMQEQELLRVRSVPGVKWAEPMFCNTALVELPQGGFYGVQLVGLGRATLIGRPLEMLEGNLADLRRPDGVFLEASGLKNLPGVKMGDILRLNDQRAQVVGICRARSGLLSKPLVYATYENSRRYVRTGRQRISFILVQVQEGIPVEQVRDALARLPHLTAFTAEEFRWQTMRFIIWRTSIGLNFAMTVALGLLVGLVVSTAAFYQFASDHLPHFALLKAVGVRPWTLIQLVFLQAGTAGAISYGIGIGLAGLLTLPGLAPDAELTASFPWPLLVGGLVPLALCVTAGCGIQLWRVLRVDPVSLFQ
jgi:putative ABC transport system permease protein